MWSESFLLKHSVKYFKKWAQRKQFNFSHILNVNLLKHIKTKCILLLTLLHSLNYNCKKNEYLTDMSTVVYLKKNISTTTTKNIMIL